MLKKSRLPMIIIFLFPAIFLYGLIFFYPTVKTIIMSFFKMGSISDKMSEWVFNGFGNYNNLLNSQLFMQSFLYMAYRRNYYIFLCDAFCNYTYFGS